MSGRDGDEMSDVAERAARGLSSAEARERAAREGPNELQRAEALPAWRIFLRQFKGALVWLLLGACVLSLALNEVTDAVAIGAILLLNAVVGFLQEHRAERALMALRSMTAPRARVLRDGRATILPAAQVVTADVLLLEAGDIVAADARLLEAHALTTIEAPLTGESTPVHKRVAATPQGTSLAERRGEIFMGTSIATGSGSAVVVATGMNTELGRIASLLSATPEQASPLQHRLERVGRVLVLLCMALVVITAVAYLARGAGLLDIIMPSISLAVAAVPEGLAAVVTVALAIGVQRMARRNVLVRRLAAVEALGSTTVICTDKTGTLTTGVMRVRQLWGPDEQRLLFAAAACCDAELAAEGEDGVGDPTEIALLRAAAERGIHRDAIERERPRREVRPFDPELKRMALLRADGTWYVKGALEVLLPRCAAGTEGALEANAEMAGRALRVLAVAEGGASAEEGLTLLGLVGIADPPRPEAIEAVAQARRAGVTTVMITGDHAGTARAIAREMGIVGDEEDAAERVHARASPEDKLRIVREWKERGAVVAMTGDGVNDAPALREAHIGVAMGITGTEVTREASDMVLTDDNFASIVAAIREGRGIYDNIQKTLLYLLVGNFAELTVMLAAAVAGLPVPLLPLQLLWINLVTDGLPALALVMDPTSPDVLHRAPRPLDERMLGVREWRYVATVGLVEASVALAAFTWMLPRYGLEHARGFTFMVLVFAELFRAFAARSRVKLFWEVGAFSNWRLLAVVVGSLMLQLTIHQVPFTRELFDLELESPVEFLVALGFGLVPVSVLEIGKLLRRAPRRLR